MELRKVDNGRQSYTNLNHINVSQLFCMIYQPLFHFSITAEYTSAPVELQHELAISLWFNFIARNKNSLLSAKTSI